MHISDSVDFVHILSGEAVPEMERREIVVRQGDVVIMRGGWHNWRNEKDQPCTVLSVMVGAHPRRRSTRQRRVHCGVAGCSS